MVKLDNGIISIGLIPSKGGTIFSFKHKKKEMIYIDRDNLLSLERPKCGIPILFPCCGRSYNDEVIFEEKKYPMPIHGFAHTETWDVKIKSENKVILVLKSSPNTKEFYPYEFLLNISYELIGNTLKIIFSCENKDTKSMPFILGFHPYFKVAQIEDTAIYIDECNGIDYNTGNRLFYNQPIEFKTENEITYIYDKPDNPVVFFNKKTKKKITIESDKYFSKLILWKGEKSRFVCIEPWGGIPNALNSKDCAKILPQKSFKAKLNITVE